MMIIPKKNKKTKIADTVFKENYLIVRWPNFSQTGSGAANLELKMYAYPIFQNSHSEKRKKVYLPLPFTYSFIYRMQKYPSVGLNPLKTMISVAKCWSGDGTWATSLAIETGRYSRPFKKPAERTCPICKVEMEDEYHFLNICPAYQEKRSSLLDYLENEYRIEISRMSPNRIFMFLINPPSWNVRIQKLIAKHIFKYFEKRKGEDGKVNTQGLLINSINYLINYLIDLI